MPSFAPRLAVIVFALLAACASPPTNGRAPAAAPVAAPRDASLDMPGYAYAAAHCAACHAIRRGEDLSPNPDATPFETIANTPGMTGYALTVWLNTSHPTMPNFIVEADRIEDVWAYMATLKK
jgi:mono/diheme cytochrome c family protein